MSAAPKLSEPDRAAPPPLLIEGLSAGFGARLVLRHVSLAVAAGGVTAVLGPNGAGKTTLVRAICGRLHPRAGAVRICGLAAEDGAARRLIGLAPQESALYGSLTIAENLRTFARLAGLTGGAARARAEEVMAHAGIAARAHERVDRLSGGWRRRTNVAAALVGAPRLLVLDEPTVGIDAPARQDLAHLVRRLAAEGLAILLVTHDFAFAEEVADRVAFLVAGEIVHGGDLGALLAEHFAGRRVVELAFMAPPAPDLAAHLRALGLRQGETPTTFCGLVPDEAQAVADLLATLKTFGAMPRTIALKPAGLDTLYDVVIRQAQAADRVEREARP